MNSLISVVIPAYNRGAAIRETIESVLAQTVVEQAEIIVIDDGSTDDTLEFLNIEYSVYDNVRIIHQPNAGVAAARNRGLQEARGEFIAFLDHDDIWLPQKLSSQLAVFENNPKLAVVCCRWRDIDSAGKLLISDEDAWAARKLPRGNVYKQFLRYNALVSMSVPLMRAQALRDIGGFDVKAAPCDDWDLWLRLSRGQIFDYVDEVLVWYRRHEDQQSRASERMNGSSKYLLRKQSRQLWLHPTHYFVAVTACAFIDTVDLYAQAKSLLFRQKWSRVAQTILKATLRNALSLLSVEWLYLIKRLVARDSRPY